jgi:DNA polymerase III alpha subunit
MGITIKNYPIDSMFNLVVDEIYCNIRNINVDKDRITGKYRLSFNVIGVKNGQEMSILNFNETSDTPVNIDIWATVYKALKDSLTTKNLVFTDTI